MTMTSDDVPVLDTLQMAVRHYDGEVEAINDIWLHSNTGTITVARRKTTCQELFDYWATNMMPLQGGDSRLFQVVGSDRTSTTLATSSSSPRVPVLGSGASSLPLFCCIRLDFKTGIAGVWYNGKNYMPGLPEDKVTKSHIDATWAESVRIAYEGLIAWSAARDFTWVVVSRSFAGLFRVSAVITPITSVIVPDLRVRTWRQRIARYGT